MYESYIIVGVRPGRRSRPTAPYLRTTSSTATVSPRTSRSAFRYWSLIGITYPPSFGHSAVFHALSRIRTSAGIIPHPYVTSAAIAWIVRAPSGGTLMKWYGAGPRQYQSSPANASSTAPLLGGRERPRSSSASSVLSTSSSSRSAGGSIGGTNRRLPVVDAASVASPALTRRIAARY